MPSSREVKYVQKSGVSVMANFWNALQRMQSIHSAYMCRLTLERLNQLEPWISAMADDFDEAAIKAEEDAAKKQADALLAEVSKERRNTDRLRLKDHGDTRDRRRRSRSRERDRYTLWTQLLLSYTVGDLLHHHDTLAIAVICVGALR